MYPSRPRSLSVKSTEGLESQKQTKKHVRDIAHRPAGKEKRDERRRRRGEPTTISSTSDLTIPPTGSTYSSRSSSLASLGGVCGSAVGLETSTSYAASEGCLSKSSRLDVNLSPSGSRSSSPSSLWLVLLVFDRPPKEDKKDDGVRVGGGLTSDGRAREGEDWVFGLVWAFGNERRPIGSVGLGFE